MLSKKEINIKKLLNNKKNLRLDKFIDLALYERNGYYLSKKPIGRKFDFVTSPEISQMFGEIIGVYLLYHWKEKINSKFNLIEYVREPDLHLGLFFNFISMGQILCIPFFISGILIIQNVKQKKN